MLLFHALRMDRQGPAHQPFLVGSGGLMAAMDGSTLTAVVIECLGLLKFDVFACTGGRGDICHHLGNLAPHGEFTLKTMVVVALVIRQ